MYTDRKPATFVCAIAASEPWPVWFGNNLKLHWGLADPSKVTGSDETKAAAFRATIAYSQTGRASGKIAIQVRD